MLRAAILDDYQGVAMSMADWSTISRDVQPVVFREHMSTESEVVEALRGFDVVVAMRERTPFPRSTLKQLPNLRLLVTTGMRNAAIDLGACRELGITVCGTEGSGPATAELAWALILACARRLTTEVGNVRGGGWMTTLGEDLHGRTLGLLGLGRLGSRVATVGGAFGMQLIAWSQNLTEERCAELGVQRVDRDELFQAADFLTIHLVLSDRTRGLVGERELRLMKPTAWLVNTSRGPICDESALARACAQRWIAGAAVDTYDVEPLPVDHPFRELDNVVATPHIGYVTESTYRAWFGQVVEDIAAFLRGSPTRVISGTR